MISKTVIKERSFREIVLLSPNSHPQTKSGEQDSGYLQDPSARNV